MLPSEAESHSEAAGAPLLQALFAVQQEVKNQKKDANNPHFKSKYVSLPELLDYARPLLNKHGLLLEQCPMGGDSEGVRVETRVWHVKSGNCHTSVLNMPFKGMTQTGAQAVGSAITYARRYALEALLGICGEDDDAEAAMGHSAGHKPPPQRQSPGGPLPNPRRPEPARAAVEPVTEATRARIGELRRAANMTLPELQELSLKVNGLADLGKLTEPQGRALLAQLTPGMVTAAEAIQAVFPDAKLVDSKEARS